MDSMTYRRITFREVKLKSGKIDKSYSVKYDNNLGNCSSKTFALKKFKTKDDAYQAAVAFFKKQYPYGCF